MQISGALLLILAFAGAGYILLQMSDGIMTTKLSAQQIAAVAEQAGFTGGDLQVAVAVALAESGGNPGVVGDTAITPGGSVGLWQINLQYHPEFSGWDLTDPQENANAAFSVYTAAGNSFQPWSTYKNSAYSAFIVQAQKAVNG